MTLTGRKPIVQCQIIRAPQAAVFEAWRDKDSLSVWMCPSPSISHASVDVDFRVGGRFTIVMHGEDQDYAHEGEYLEIDAPNRLVFSWISSFMPAGEQKTRVTVSLEPSGESATLLTLVHDELPAGESYDGHVEGWAEILRKFATVNDREE